MRTPGEEQFLRAAGTQIFTTKTCLLAESDDAETAVTVVVVAGSEEELIGVAVHAAALAELNGPDIVDLDGLPARVAERAEEGAALGIKGVDAPAGRVIRDEERIAHGPEVGGRQRDAPRRMERAGQREVR
jgi:hypothetical protein